jgi:hypothetical protein
MRSRGVARRLAQVLLVLLKKQPPAGRRLLVLGTTSALGVMEDMGIATTFNVCLEVPALKETDIRAVLASLKAFAPTDVGFSPFPSPICASCVAPCTLAVGPCLERGVR